MRLSIVIPAHNEEVRLPAVLASYARYFASRLGDAVELVVATNHCDDDTVGVAKAVANDYPQIKVLEEKRRIGKGGAVIMGVKAARGDWIGFVDADGATAPEEFDRLYQAAQNADGVIASRWMPGARVTIHQKRVRLLASRLFNMFIRLLLGLKYKDTQCGAKIFRADAWRHIMPYIGITRFAFDVDLLFQLKRHGFRVIEEPTVWHDVAGSTVQVFQSSLDMFLAVVRMRLLYSPLRFVVPVFNRFFGNAVEFLRGDPLFRHTVLLSLASIIANICNVLFQMIVGRALPQAEYALLVTFLAIYAISARPMGTLSTTMNHYTSILLKKGKIGLLGRLIVKWGLLTTIPSSIVAVICIVFSARIAAFFHLERIEPVIVAAAALPVLCAAPVLGGVLIGMQRFAQSALASTVGAISRVALAAALVILIHPAPGWALTGHVGGMYVSFMLVAIFLLPVIINRDGDGERLPSLRFYLFWCFLIQFSTALLMTGDIVLVRRFLPQETAFAYAATLGRMAAFMSATVVAAMFPKVATDGDFTREHHSIYLRSLAYTGGFVLLSMLLCIGIPGPLLRFLFGIREPGARLLSLTRWMSVIMAVSAVLNINVNLLLAQRRFKLLTVTILCALCYIGAVRLWHASAYSVVAAAGLANVAALAITTVGILRMRSFIDAGEKDGAG